MKETPFWHTNTPTDHSVQAGIEGDRSPANHTWYPLSKAGLALSAKGITNFPVMLLMLGLGPYWNSSWCLIRGKREVNSNTITIWDCCRYCLLPLFSRREGGSFVSSRLTHPMFGGLCLMLCPRRVFYLSSIYFMPLIISILPALAGQIFLEHFPLFQNWWEEVMGKNTSAHRKPFWACFLNMYLFQNPGRSFHLCQKDLDFLWYHLTRQYLQHTHEATALMKHFSNYRPVYISYGAWDFSLFMLFIYLFIVELTACGLIAQVCPQGVCCRVQSIRYVSLPTSFSPDMQRAPRSLCWHWQLTPITQAVL